MCVFYSPIGGSSMAPLKFYRNRFGRKNFLKKNQEVRKNSDNTARRVCAAILFTVFSVVTGGFVARVGFERSDEATDLTKAWKRSKRFLQAQLSQIVYNALAYFFVLQLFPKSRTQKKKTKLRKKPVQPARNTRFRRHRNFVVMIIRV